MNVFFTGSCTKVDQAICCSFQLQQLNSMSSDLLKAKGNKTVENVIATIDIKERLGRKSAGTEVPLSVLQF